MDGAGEVDGDARLDGPLALRSLRLPPGIARRTVTIDVDGHLCAGGAAWCGELLQVDEGSIDVVLPNGDRRRLGAGSLLAVTGLGAFQLRTAGDVRAVLTGVRRVRVDQVVAISSSSS